LVELPLQGASEQRGVAHRLLPGERCAAWRGDGRFHLQRGDGQRPLPCRPRARLGL